MNRFLLSVFALLAFCGIPLQAADMPRPEYPRPQFVREAWQNLNSTWTFHLHPKPTGAAHLGHFWATSIADMMR